MPIYMLVWRKGGALCVCVCMCVCVCVCVCVFCLLLLVLFDFCLLCGFPIYMYFTFVNTFVTKSRVSAFVLSNIDP